MVSTARPPQVKHKTPAAPRARKGHLKNAVRAFPTKQQRSEDTHNELLKAGRALLDSGGFDDVSIAQIAARARCAVGSFYLRFRNKEAYFEFLLDGILTQVQQDTLTHFSADQVKALNLADTVKRCMDHYVAIHRQHEGLIRAALQYSINGSNDWQPIRDSGLWLHGHYIELIMGKLRRQDTQTAREQLQIGLQIVSGHLVNTIAHPAGALPLQHPALSHWLCEMVLHSLKIVPPATGQHVQTVKVRRASTDRPPSTPIRRRN